MHTWRKSVAVILSYIQDAIFPQYCLGCKSEGNICCKECLKKIPTAGVFFCPVCQSATDRGVVCEGCIGKGGLRSHIAIAPYNHDLVGLAIEQLKYHYMEEYMKIFHYMIQEFFTQDASLCSHIDCIVPIPLHKKRYVERGFNQSDLIAKSVSEVLDIPIKQYLKRQVYTKQQAKYNREERFANVSSAFILDAKEIAGENILLIDDVFTTGATMQSAARVLKDAGSKVYGFSIARGK
ncbi:MAG: ComF family protein [Candidatus Magasanikbacteria bacterium]|mgnify:CR=1 FL=1|jgi:ComF family protein|nr:ComF family protein [Candidatus Magasanikbacteria bacterium]MBT4071690.1 ComF family protein [Candidatus Magasanikbacteria bacterium]